MGGVSLKLFYDETTREINNFRTVDRRRLLESEIILFQHGTTSKIILKNLVFYMLSPVRLSSVCLSVVCNARAPYSGGSNFPQYFYGI